MGFFWGGGFEIMFSLVFFLLMIIMVVMLVKGLGQWNKNNHAPRLVVDATVVAKRIQVGHHGTGGGNNMASHTYTCYYVTFQVESGDRMELRVNGAAYGMLAEGDVGRLTFQGSRYLGFQR